VIILANHIRRAAHGKHHCTWCGKRIDAHEQYRDTRCADNGTAWTWRAHLRCDDFVWKAAREAEWDVDDGLGPDDFRELVHGNPELANEMGVT
jgi:predicted RNA-binding Zn-ribbon protein involved in translation (DUF1610 family)